VRRAGERPTVVGMPKERPPCPVCGTTPKPILYGYATPLPAELGEYVLAGCVIDADAPKWACPQCGHRFGRLGDEDETLSAEPRFIDNPWDWFTDKVSDVRDAVDDAFDRRDSR
jgi:rubredoxin